MQGTASSTEKSLNTDGKPTNYNCIRWSQRNSQRPEGVAVYDCQREHGLKSCLDCSEYPKEWEK
jgi:hypothetical protein